MRQPKTAMPSTGAVSVRVVILAALIAALVLIAGQARPASAVNEGGTFSFSTNAMTVNEGEIAQLQVVFLGRSDVTNSGDVSLGLNITLGSADPGDVSSSDFCFHVEGAVLSPIQVPIPTSVDADLDDETFTVTLTVSSASVPCAGGNAVVGGPDTITVTIEDTGTGSDENTFEFVSTASNGEEGDTLTLNVLREGDLDGAASVQCAVVGGTAEGPDYTLTDGTANFGDNDPSGSCEIQLLADADTDIFETIQLRLQNPSAGHVVVEPDEHTITIVDDDAELIQFSAPTYSVSEDGGSASFTVTRSNPSGSDTVVCRSVEQPNEADEDLDYSETDDVLVFSGSDTSESCTVPILVDNLVEGDETFGLELEITAGDASLGPNDEAVVTIEDGDSTQVYTFQSATYTVVEAAGIVTVTVVRSSNLGTGAVSWDITGGTATAGVDYIDTSGTVTFTAGQTTQTFNITIIPTATAEASETIVVSLLNPVNGTLGNPDDTTITITEIGPPTVTDVNPDNVPTAGGTSVIITGTNFTGATQVMFGAVNATSFVMFNSTQITAVAPARNAGTYDIRVTTPAGTSANTANDDITYGTATQTVTYNLSVRWSLIAWLGKNNANIASALQGTVSLSDSQAQAAPNNIFNLVTAVATWDNPTQRYLFWFPAGGSVPGANDITQFKFGTPYWIAVTANVNWTVIEGP